MRTPTLDGTHAIKIDCSEHNGSLADELDVHPVNVPIAEMFSAIAQSRNDGDEQALARRASNSGDLMRHLLAAAAASTLWSSAALAQTTPAQNGPQNPAVKSVRDNNSSQAVNGANSFTKGEAKSQIEAKGYTHVTDLKKDQSGVWRGKATKGSQSGPVSVDYQGNVN